MAITVRKIQPNDQDAWLDLYLAYLKFYDTEANEASVQLVWQRLTSAEPSIAGLVAEADGRVLGFAHFHFQLSTWAQNWHCYLEDLYVDENSRGQGAATALINEVKVRATDQRASELYWITRATNATARGLYDKVATATDFIRYEILLDR